ncbi:unnamed protein product, partial [Ectocarpus sp. 12 AP-2014]
GGRRVGEEEGRGSEEVGADGVRHGGGGCYRGRRSGGGARRRGAASEHGGQVCHAGKAPRGKSNSDDDVFQHDLLGGVGGPVSDRDDRASDQQGPVRGDGGRRHRALAVHGHGGHRGKIAGCADLRKDRPPSRGSLVPGLRFARLGVRRMRKIIIIIIIIK